MNGSNPDGRIPLAVGITGHRQIRPEDRQKICSSVKAELAKLKSAYPSTPVIMLNSLAEGGDLLCAEAAEELDIPLYAVLPMDIKEYEEDYSPEGLEEFRRQLGRAAEWFVTPYTETPEEPVSRNFLYRQAGIYVAAHCHVLIALWDGGPGTPAACGTAEAVDFALQGAYRPQKGVSYRSGDNTRVIHIFTPRNGHDEKEAGTVEYLGNRTDAEDILAKTEEYNALALSVPGNMESLLPEPQPEASLPAKLDRVYQAADALSMAFSKTYRKVLSLLAAASTVLTLAFLLYDEAEIHWMVLVCGVMLFTAFFCRRYAVRSACHRRYIEYRALAECIRVQAFLRYAGSSLEAASLLSWTQQLETAWILDALCSLDTGKALQEKKEIRESWVNAQGSYHKNAALKTGRNLKSSDRIVSTALALSICLYFVVLIFELVSGGLFNKIFLPAGNMDLVRVALKLLLGTISAGTLFIANYYGKQSLSRQKSDHEKMARFYDKMASLLSVYGQSDELLEIIAREELTENGNWVSYQRDNTPDFSL